MKGVVRWATCGLLLLATQVVWAQTVIRMAPPAPVQVGVVGRPPGAGYVWTNGFYRWRGGRYVWMPGTWMRPPYRGAVWIQPRWVPGGGGWVFHKGYWR
jgi:WXXGXW repeat (2 copies)